MLATGVWNWWGRQAVRRPGTWALAGTLTLLVPILSRLSPFPEIDVDPVWSFARSWTFPVELLGASFALAFLTLHQEVLSHLAPRTRWVGEIGVLFLGSLSLVFFLLLGSLLGSPGGSRELLPLVADILAASVHLAALGSCLMRLPAPASLRIAGLWALPWAIPALAGSTRATALVDAGRVLRATGSLSSEGSSPLSTIAIAAGLLAAAFLLAQPRTTFRSR